MSVDDALKTSFGHNQGPPLDERVPEWGEGPVGTYFHWKRAHRAAWRRVPHTVKMWRLEDAEALGLTYEEYTLEILERGNYLREDSHARRIAEIKRARRWRDANI